MSHAQVPAITPVELDLRPSRLGDMPSPPAPRTPTPSVSHLSTPSTVMPSPTRTGGSRTPPMHELRRGRRRRTRSLPPLATPGQARSTCGVESRSW